MKWYTWKNHQNDDDDVRSPPLFIPNLFMGRIFFHQSPQGLGTFKEPGKNDQYAVDRTISKRGAASLLGSFTVQYYANKSGAKIVAIVVVVVVLLEKRKENWFS
jgi:hypothetical protein